MGRGDCPLGPRTTRGSLASLYTAYAVDMLSDLMSKPANTTQFNEQSPDIISNGFTYKTSLEPSDGARTESSGDCVVRIWHCMHGFCYLTRGPGRHQIGKQHCPKSNMAGSLDHSGECYRHLYWLLSSLCHPVPIVSHTSHLVRYERLRSTQPEPIQ